MAPTYEPPSCPLSEQAVNKLGDITRTRQMNTYKTQVKEALKGLADAIYDIQAQARDRQAQLAHMQKTRKNKNKDKSEHEIKLEEHIAELEEEVQDLTLQAEELIRSCIDQNFAVEDDSKIVSELYTSATSAHRARRDADQSEDQPPAESLVNKVKELRQQKVSAWESESNYNRYAKNNDYINFKRLWRDGAVSEDGPVLPNANRWFREDGEPVMTISRGGANGGDDSDEDVAVARETISLTCPLSMLPLKEPYTNKHCGHTFDKASIMDFLRGSSGQALACPTTGCDQVGPWSPRALWTCN